MPKGNSMRHGMRHTGTYTSWHSMISRCLYKGSGAYGRYGAKGITVCDQWVGDFMQFFKDMGERPEGYELDRIDGEKGYSPENCQWLSKKENARKNSRTKLSEDDVSAIKTMLKYGKKPQKEISKYFDVEVGMISRIKTGEHWGDISPMPV